MEGFSLRAAMGASGALDRAEQKEMMSFATDTIPMRIRDIYLIKQPWYFTLFWKLVKVRVGRARGGCEGEDPLPLPPPARAGRRRARPNGAPYHRTIRPPSRPCPVPARPCSLS
jgi:hypothetical protein